MVIVLKFYQASNSLILVQKKFCFFSRTGDSAGCIYCAMLGYIFYSSHNAILRYFNEVILQESSIGGSQRFLFIGQIRVVLYVK